MLFERKHNVEAKKGSFRLIKTHRLKMLLKANGKTGHCEQHTGKDNVVTALKVLGQLSRNTKS
jgi:hypothetical protein